MEAPECQFVSAQAVRPTPEATVPRDVAGESDAPLTSGARRAAIEEELRSILGRTLKCPPAALPPPDESLVDALHIDSILFLELIVATEDAFGHYIPLDLWLEERIQAGGTAACTPSSLVDFVSRQLGAGDPAGDTHLRKTPFTR